MCDRRHSSARAAPILCEISHRATPLRSLRHLVGKCRSRCDLLSIAAGEQVFNGSRHGRVQSDPILAYSDDVWTVRELAQHAQRFGPTALKQLDPSEVAGDRVDL